MPALHIGIEGLGSSDPDQVRVRRSAAGGAGRWLTFGQAASFAEQTAVGCEEVRMAQTRILVADDDPEMRRLVRFILERDGYKVLEAEDGEQALSLAFDASPSVILLDVRMPKMDGYDVCRRLRSDTRTRRVPIIFISALSSARNQTDGLRLGAIEYLTKPINLKQLADRICFALQRHAFASLYD